LFYFFFQAEDGIRDFHVTGVQTCALPISLAQRVLLHERVQLGRDERVPAEREVGLDPVLQRGEPELLQAPRLRLQQRDLRHVRRSEERRVGKEWRYRSRPAEYRRRTRRHK